MKISEILVESQQVDEGPLLNKIGAGIGKVAGTVAKGIGAVAGGVVGAGKALAKGYQAGKTTVGGAGDDIEADPATDGTAGGATATTPTAKTKPAAGGAPVGGPTTQPGAGAVNKSGPAGTAPAKTLAGQAKVAADKTAAATAGQDPSAAGQTMYAQVKANIDKLDKKGKQRILQLLQKSVAAPEQKPAAAGGAPAKPAAGKPGASPAAGGTGFGYDGNTGLPFNSQAERDAGLAKQKADKAAATSAPAADPGAGAMGAMAGQLAKGGAAEPNTMANAPVSKTNTARPGNPNAAPAAEPTAVPAVTTKKTGGRVKGQLSQDPRAVKRREANAAKQQATEPKKKPAAPDQATIDAERERIMGPTSDSIIRTRPIMAEGFSLFRKH